MRKLYFFARDLKYQIHRLYNLIRFGDADLFQEIDIAISTACNYRCHYCPQSIAPLKQNIISPELWNVFLQRIKESGWHGKVCIHNYNEPAIVPHSERYVADLVKLRCKPMIYTNGSKPDVVEKWIQAGARRILVTEHPPFRPEWWKALKPVVQKHRLKVIVRRLSENLNSRGGKIKVKNPKLFDKCISNVKGLYIDWDGNTFLCCEDYDMTSKTQDNIRTMTLKEMWFNSSLAKKRQLVRKGIPAIKICKICFGTNDK